VAAQRPSPQPRRPAFSRPPFHPFGACQARAHRAHKSPPASALGGPDLNQTGISGPQGVALVACLAHRAGADWRTGQTFRLPPRGDPRPIACRQDRRRSR